MPVRSFPSPMSAFLPFLTMKGAFGTDGEVQYNTTIDGDRLYYSDKGSMSRC